jgi:hypothetical protein
LALDAGKSADRPARDIEDHRRLAPAAEPRWSSASGACLAQRRNQISIDVGGLDPWKRASEVGCGTGVLVGSVARNPFERILLVRAITGSPLTPGERP